ncbi:probable cytochrome P450 9f2 [Epargyreus clarus]|uniref:probable cytochrome P450 9f2 n=1 Tax=Epargyreus clarus TaxID=520877 RepID=UPI003C2E0B67
MIVEILVFLLTTLIAYFFYIHKSIHKKFDDAGIKYKPGIPVFGNTYKSSLVKRHIFEEIDEVYRAFPDEKYVGYIEATTPILIIRDPELIKNITVKDFDHFADHKPFFPEDIEPLFGSSLIMMKGDKWRDMRTTLSPAFTSSKMRLMMPFMTEISNNLIQYLNAHLNEDVDIGDLMRRYTNDVIASAAFGLQVDSLKEKENDFYKLGQAMFIFTPLQRFYMFFIATFPSLAKFLKIQVFSDKVTKFFNNIVFSTMSHREQNNIERPDMIQLLMEASKGSLKNTSTHAEETDHLSIVGDTFKPQTTSRKWTQNELAGQVFIFFIAGFETTASTLTMIIHELALNPHIEEKLYQEIKIYKEQNKELTYDNLNKLKYLDCVINESFRKWAAALIMDRTCTKAYELPPPREGGKPYVIQPGEYVYNMVNSVHLDPKYYPNPEVFDPERFSDENKHKIQPCTFMPFGVGPRNCIGSRFALMEVKVLLFNLLSKFKIVKSPKTTDPIRLLAQDFNIKSVGGSWIKLEERK